MGKNFSCNNSGKRNKNDFYQTPYSLTRLFLNTGIVPKEATILEPACGEGAISHVLNEYHYSHTAYDIEYDFLTETQKHDWIITNPPYSKALEFILKAKEVSDNFAFLLPLSYLHGVERFNKIYSDEQYPLNSVYIFTRYPLLEQTVREDGQHKTGMMVYAWFVFKKR